MFIVIGPIRNEMRKCYESASLSSTIFQILDFYIPKYAKSKFITNNVQNIEEEQYHTNDKSNSLMQCNYCT